MKRAWVFAVALVLLASCAAPAMDAAIPAVETGVDPEAWATIPAGSFVLGQHEVEIDITYDYEMMVTDVTNAQYADFLNAATSFS